MISLMTAKMTDDPMVIPNMVSQRSIDSFTGSCFPPSSASVALPYMDGPRGRQTHTYTAERDTLIK